MNIALHSLESTERSVSDGCLSNPLGDLQNLHQQCSCGKRVGGNLNNYRVSPPALLLELEKENYQLRLALQRTTNGSTNHLWDNPTAGHTPELGTHIQTHDGYSLELRDINLAIDYVDLDIHDVLAGGLPNDVVFSMPTADQGHGAPLGALDLHTIAGVDGVNIYLPTSDAPDSGTSWSSNASQVVDGAIADEDMGNFFDFPAAAMPNDPGLPSVLDLQSVPGSSMAAPVNTSELMTQNHTAEIMNVAAYVSPGELMTKNHTAETTTDMENSWAFNLAAAAMPNDVDLQSVLNLQSVPSPSMAGFAAHVSPGNLMTTNHTAPPATMAAHIPLSSSTTLPTMVLTSVTSVPAAGPRPRPYQCNTCPKSFARRGDHDRHFLTHDTTTRRPHSCSYAGCTRTGVRGFWRFDKLNDHIARRH